MDRLTDSLRRQPKDTSQISDMNDISRVLYYTHACRKIQVRLANIICILPNRPRGPKVVKKFSSLPSIEMCLKNTSHNIVHKHGSNLYKCTICHECVSHGSKNLRKFRNSQCIYVQDSNDKPSRIGTQMMVAKQITHESHELCIYRGIIFCNTCGKTGGGGTKIISLADICKGKPPLNSHGHKVKSTLAQGKQVTAMDDQLAKHMETHE